MFRVWVKIFKDNHILRDTTVVNDENLTRTKKVLKTLEQACYEFDLGVPIWLDANIADFKRVAKTQFRQESFMEHIDFDYLEFHVIEEDMTGF